MSDNSIRARGAIKKSLTHFEQFIQNQTQEIEQSMVNSEKDDVIYLTQQTINDFSMRISNVELLFCTFNDIQSKVENDAEEKDLEKQYDERIEFESRYYTALAKAKTLLEMYSPKEEVLPAISPSPDPSGNSNQQYGSKIHSIKLPTIELPKFDGNYEHWLEFKDSFESLIHKNETIESDIQRFHYLRSSLVGSAHEVIKSFEFSAANYKAAWDILCARFNNKHLLIQKHLDALFNMETFRETAFSIRQGVDAMTKHLRALESLGQPTTQWDTLLIYMVVKRLHEDTLGEWEKYRSSKILSSGKTSNDITLSNLLDFLRLRADFLETLHKGERKTSKAGMPRTSAPQKGIKSFVVINSNCSFCNKDHSIYRCSSFLKLSPIERSSKVKEQKLCFNCLGKGHVIKACKSGNCRVCHRKHNTLLHVDASPEVSVDSKKAEGVSNETIQTVAYASSVHCAQRQVLLSTVSIRMPNASGRLITVRALLDPGSQSSFISERLQQSLGLEKARINVAISGINSGTSIVNYKCHSKIHSLHDAFSMELVCLIIPEITGPLPNFSFSATELNIPKTILLADPKFNVPGPIDILLGADCFWQLLENEQRNVPGQSHGLIIRKTKLGWVVGGPLSSIALPTTVQCNIVKHCEIDIQLARFWEIEEGSSDKIYSDEELACEEHFSKTYRRDGNGRFIVKIPLRHGVGELGDSFENAKQRFQSVERKFQRLPQFKERYIEFMTNYEGLDHMTDITNQVEGEETAKVPYYLPHHGIHNEDKVTSKLRVVFDGSAPSSTGVSLNALQMIGPRIQSDLFSIIVRFRKHRYAFSADIEKMYRQILIDPEQRHLQRVIWRSDPKLPIKIYELNTVTYGTAAAAFLAIRCLYQLGIDCEREAPKLSSIIKNDFYVDDLLTGSDSYEDSYELISGVTNTLAKGGFPLRKWVSNETKILENGILFSKDTSGLVKLSDETVKTLGLLWNSQSDCFMFQIKLPDDKVVTKRSILSAISSIYDPLGLISPCVIVAKIILQRLWQEQLSWDEEVSNDLKFAWNSYKDSLASLNTLQIPRHVTSANKQNVQLHGFCDASEQAYGACIYIRTETDQGIQISLLCSKTKVAPLKSITIPRLELCGALLLANLAKRVRQSLNMAFEQIFYWTDSMIVLAWLNQTPNLLQIFVGNRVSQIQRSTAIDEWRHVPSEHNPADYLSRGVNPDQIRNLGSWWVGPSFLSQNSSSWPSTPQYPEGIPEVRKEKRSLVVIETKCELFSRYSSLSRLQRVHAYCHRFIHNLRLTKANRNLGPLTVQELENSLTKLVQLSQIESFPKELRRLQNNKHVESSSRLVSLNPFLDAKGVIRVGGRLDNSKFAYEKRHQAILSSSHTLTKLIAQYEHIRLLHVGPQTLLASIRERFWPIHGRNLAKQIVKACTRCFRTNPKTLHPIMGHLPSQRIQPSPPFTSTGVDYAGPFIILDKKGRGGKPTKCYVSVFICLVTKAIHLEIVSDLTTEAFMAALRRFSSRRGKPARIFSDNGRNFIGAKSELDKLGQFLKIQANEITEQSNSEGIAWSFIPPYAPHFGGMWEAGVKSFKAHLKRVASTAHLTFEELSTLLAQIEAVLNSRPLSPLSADPNDLNPLTPAHFLIGRSLVSVPGYDYTAVSDNRLSRFQRIQRLQMHFWTRWNKEYISELQQRSKWQQPSANLMPNILVLVKDENLPAMQWKLGRVIETHPGNDGVTRVVSVRTSTGLIKRAVTKLCPLPEQVGNSASASASLDKDTI